ncbi:MAG: hypothetical protein K940chlam6_01299 [Chlamydiae bacterium]|nr:hypothetical protein [Chlamydiota bacterium]
MRWLIGMVFLCSGLQGNLADIRGTGQTFINETLLGQGLIFQIMRDNLEAIKCVDGHKVYLKADRLVPSEEGMLLVGDDCDSILLTKVYSDQYGCYIKSSMLCASCGSEVSDGVDQCIKIWSE